VKLFRVTSSLFICASVLALAACGGADETKAGSAPAASSTVAAPAATPTSSTPADSAAGGTSDQDLCESAHEAGEKMKKDFIAAFQASGGGELPPVAELKKILTDLNDELSGLASAGAEDSEVVAALEKFGSEAAKAAKASDPATAADNPAFEKAGSDITAACKSAGVKVNF
jgi:hypothetical protein